MRERVLVMDLGVVCAKFRVFKLVTFEIDDAYGKVTVTGIFDESERYVAELEYTTITEREHIIDALLGAGFIQSETRSVEEE